MSSSLATHSSFLLDLARAPRLRPPLRFGMHEQLDGRYELAEPLGEGSFGVVYKARDRKLGRTVAIKLIRREGDGDANAVRELLAARIEPAPPNVVTLFDAGVHEGYPYLVFEYLEGQTLQDRIQLGKMPVREALFIACQVARGLRAAHLAGVLHRDLKPSNIFLTNSGEVKLLDFGLAHRLEDQQLLLPRGGTPGFAPPEQAAGQPGDARSDVFSAAMTLYVCLYGGLPLNTLTFDFKTFRTEPPAPEAILRLTAPKALKKLLIRATSRDASTRPDSLEWHERLERMLGIEMAPAPHVAKIGLALSLTVGISIASATWLPSPSSLLAALSPKPASKTALAATAGVDNQTRAQATMIPSPSLPAGNQPTAVTPPRAMQFATPELAAEPARALSASAKPKRRTSPQPAAVSSSEQAAPTDKSAQSAAVPASSIRGLPGVNAQESSEDRAADDENVASESSALAPPSRPRVLSRAPAVQPPSPPTFVMNSAPRPAPLPRVARKTTEFASPARGKRTLAQAALERQQAERLQAMIREKAINFENRPNNRSSDGQQTVFDP